MRKDKDYLVQYSSYKKKVALLKILAHPVRLAILAILEEGPKCVNDTEKILGISQSNLSQHLCLLRREGVLDFYESGKQHCYYLRKPEMIRDLIQFIEKDYSEPDRQMP